MSEKIDLAELAELADYKTAPQIMADELFALVRAVRAVRAMGSVPYEDLVPAMRELSAALAPFTDSSDSAEVSDGR